MSFVWNSTIFLQDRNQLCNHLLLQRISSVLHKKYSAPVGFFFLETNDVYSRERNRCICRESRKKFNRLTNVEPLTSALDRLRDLLFLSSLPVYGVACMFMY